MNQLILGILGITPGAFKLTTKPVYHKLSKHVNAKQYFLLNAVYKNIRKIKQKSKNKNAYSENVSIHFTKGLNAMKFAEKCGNIMSKLHLESTSGQV